MYGYIYLTINLINGKKYVGKHKSSEFNPNYKGSGKLLWKAINKYGEENFKTELLIECNSLEELNQCEIDEIKRRDAVLSKEYYNLSLGGAGGFDYINSHRDEITFNPPDLKGSKNPNYGNPSGYKHSEETRKKMSEGQRKYVEVNGHGTRKGIRHSEESRQKMRESIGKSSYLISEYRQGRIWVNKELPDGRVERHQSSEEELSMYLLQGFTVGYGKRKQAPNKGKLRITKDGKIKYCSPEDFDLYRSQGWEHSTGNLIK